MKAPRFFIVYKYCHVDEEFYTDVTEHYLVVEPMEGEGAVRWAMTDSLGRVDIIFEAQELKIYDPWSGKLVLRIEPNGDISGKEQPGMRAKAIEIWSESLKGGGTGESQKDDGYPSRRAQERAQAHSG